MKTERLLHRTLSFCLLLLAFIDRPLMANPLPQTLPIVIPAPPAVGAKSYILIDAKSDHIITEQKMHERVEPASLTKMMTIYVVDHAIKSGKLKPTDLIHISEKAWRMEGSRTFLETNATVPADALIKGVIIQSGNDASVALAEHIAGTETSFSELMNFYAQQLGMKNTHFVNATGLPDPNHYTTAYDMALLGKALIRDFPETYSVYSQKWYTYQGIKQMNRNRLLWRNEKVDGIKTGHTESAGFCLVASGQQNDMRLIAVVMGTASDEARTEQANTLLSYGFRFYETHKLYTAGTALKQARIWMGQQKEVPVGLSQDLYVTVSQGQYPNLKALLEVHPLIKAPATQGSTLGALKVQFEDKVISETPLVALQNITPGGLFSRMCDYVTLSGKALWDKVRL